MAYIGVVATLALIVWVVLWSANNWNVKNKRLVVVTNLVVLVVVLGIAWYTFPVFASWLIYRVIWLNLFYIIPIIVGVVVIRYLVYLPVKNHKRVGGAQIAIYTLFGLILMLGGIWILPSAERWQAAQNQYEPLELERPIAIDRSAIRYTPIQVAYKFMRGTVNSSRFTVKPHYLDPIILGDGFAYVAPITPDGWFQEWRHKNRGFMIFKDDQRIPLQDQIISTNQEFEIGEGMEWRDDISLQLYLKDMFTRYGDVFYQPLDSTDMTKLTAVVPKIKYKLQAPMFWIPVWGGVALVHDTGEIEELTPNEALSDERLEGMMLYPLELVRYMVEIQNYRVKEGVSGLWGGINPWLRWEGKIEIPELPGDNQMPFLMKGNDGNPYGVVTTEPVGSSEALFRIYYVNLRNGDFTYYEFDPDAGVIGPRAALDAARSKVDVPRWSSEEVPGLYDMEDVIEGDDRSSSDFVAIEPLPFPLEDGSFYWQVSTTTERFATVSKTALVDAPSRGNVVHVFDSPIVFYDWANPQGDQFVVEADTLVDTSGTSLGRSAITGLLAEAREILEGLKQLVGTLEQLEARE